MNHHYVVFLNLCFQPLTISRWCSKAFCYSCWRGAPTGGTSGASRARNIRRPTTSTPLLATRKALTTRELSLTLQYELGGLRDIEGESFYRTGHRVTCNIRQKKVGYVVMLWDWHIRVLYKMWYSKWILAGRFVSRRKLNKLCYNAWIGHWCAVVWIVATYFGRYLCMYICMPWLFSNTIINMVVYCFKCIHNLCTIFAVYEIAFCGYLHFVLQILFLFFISFYTPGF